MTTPTVSGDSANDLEQAKTAVARATGRRVVDASGQIDQAAVALNVFDALLEKEGVRAALYSLLRLTNYRYISVFRFKDGKATSTVHVDRQNLNVLQADEVDDTATYCCYVRDIRSTFVTEDASKDPETATHVAKDAVRAYAGIPIFAANGELIGTLCHYDTEPRDPQQLDMAILTEVARKLAAPGLIPPYPNVDRQPG